MTGISVISLPSATGRREEFATQARFSRLPWRFVDAKSAPQKPLIYTDGGARRRFGRALTPGEVGCYASHYGEWTDLLASSDEQRLVLEDDVMVDWNSLEQLVNLDISKLGLDLVRLYSTHPFRQHLVANRFLGPHMHLVQVHGMFLGTQGYLLTRRAAARLVAMATAIERPVDWLMARYWEYGFPNYCVFPFPLIEKHVSSHIGDRSEPSTLSIEERAVHFAGRVVDRLSRSVADHFRFPRHPFGRGSDAGPSVVDRHHSARAAPSPLTDRR